MTKIKRILLTSPVSIQGKNIFGFNSEVTFEPTKNKGWYFLNKKTGKTIPLNRNTIFSGKNNLYARNENEIIHVLEHLLPLRLLGLDNINLSIVSHYLTKGWPPVLTAKSVWEYLKMNNNLLETDEYIDRFVITRSYCSDPSHTTTHRRTVLSPLTYYSGPVDNIVVKVQIKYPRIGYNEKIYKLADIYELLGSLPQGYPYSRYYLCKIMSVLFGWPHLGKITWLQNNSLADTKILFSDHRALDIFGALAAIDHEKLPSDLYVFSNCSGHKFDQQVNKKISL